MHGSNTGFGGIMKTYDGLCVIWYNIITKLYQEQTFIPLVLFSEPGVGRARYRRSRDRTDSSSPFHTHGHARREFISSRCWK